MKRMMLPIIGLLGVALVVTPCAFSGEPEQKGAGSTAANAEAANPKEILKKAEAALKKVKQVRYKAEYKGTEWVTAFVPSLEGTAMLGEPSQHDIARFRCEVKLTPRGESEAIELSAGSDGDLYYLIDPAKKMVFADIDEAVLGKQQRNLQRVLLRDFVAKEPLAEDLKAEKVELLGTEDVGGEPCHKVRVTRSETQRVVWYLSQKDWLPRRVVRLYKNQQGEEGSTQLLLTDLVAEPKLNAKKFELTVPKGFTKTDEFAP
jgi:outer membrane lipoprotein-sorting protein